MSALFPHAPARRARPGPAEFEAVGLAHALAPAPAGAAPAPAGGPSGALPEGAPLPPGWALHPASGCYVHDALVLALFAHPGHVRAAAGAGPGGAPGAGAACLAHAQTAEARAWLQTLPAEERSVARADARALEEGLPPEDSNFLPLLCAMVEKSTDYHSFMERVRAGRRQFKKLVVTLNAAHSLSLAGDRDNAVKFRDKVPALIPECVSLGDRLFEDEQYAKAAEHLRVAAVVYMGAGRRFRMALGQILDRLAFCNFMEKRLDEAVRMAEHAMYMLATSGEEVEWALVTVASNMGKYYRTLGHECALLADASEARGFRNKSSNDRALDLTRLALLCFNFCLHSTRETEYLCVTEKQMKVVDSYDSGALIWMPETDELFIPELMMLVGLCLISLDRREPALEICNKAFDLYQAFGDSPRPLQSYILMTIVCYNNGLYRECIKYADAVWGRSLAPLNKMQCVALFYSAHATAMCGCYVQAIDMFRVLERMPPLSDADRSGIPAKLMFADCLKAENRHAEAIALLKDALRALAPPPPAPRAPGPPPLPNTQLLCHHIMLASCYVDTRDFDAARQHLALSSPAAQPGVVPQSFLILRSAVEDALEGLARDLEDRALRASRELCPDFEPGAREGPNGARGGRRARARAAQAPVARARAAQAAPEAGASALGSENPGDAEPPEPSECCVCLAAPATVAFSPCFHRCVCATCADSVIRNTGECPLCCTPSVAAHEILDDGSACARCGVAPRTVAVAPCFHMQFCIECAPCALHDSKIRCSTCAGSVSRTHRVFRLH